MSNNLYLETFKKKEGRARIVVVTSGKGGVGKTTTSAAIAATLAKRGYRTVVIDFDVGLRNLDLVMGCERRIVFDLIHLMNRECNINQALIRDKRVRNLYILAASQTKDKDALNKEVLGEILSDLSKVFDYIVCDSPAGIEKGAQMSMYYADDAIIVTNPEVSSVHDSDRILGILNSKTFKSENGESIKEHLLITRFSAERAERGEMLSIVDIKDILAINLIGVVPESMDVLKASNSGTPVTLDDENSIVSLAYGDSVDRFLGVDKPFRFLKSHKKGFFKRLFGGQ